MRDMSEFCDGNGLCLKGAYRENSDSPLAEIKRRCERAPKSIVAKDLGITPSMLSTYLSGERPITIAFADKLGFTFVWKRK